MSDTFWYFAGIAGIMLLTWCLRQFRLYILKRKAEKAKADKPSPM